MTGSPRSHPQSGGAPTRSGRETWGSVFFASVWLVYLAEPLAYGWRERDTTHGLAGFIATLGFALVYVGHFRWQRSRTWSGAESTGDLGSSVWIGYGLLIAAAAASTLALGQVGSATWVFLAVSGFWTMSWKPALVIAVILAVGYEIVAGRLPGWNRDSGVSLSIAMASIAVLGAIFYSRRSRDLADARRENARLAVEEERGRIARDLHDILGHSLSVITVKAQLAARLIELDPARAQGEIESLEQLAREALADVRGAVGGVRQISLAGELARAKSSLAAAGIEARLPGSIDAVRPKDRELYAWTVRECVTNIIRHSQATQCQISIGPDGLHVRDNGRGRALAAGPGSGLKGLSERAQEVGAVVVTRTGADGGFSVDVLPAVVGQ